MSQYVHLGSGGKAGLVERTYSQATTTGQHTLVLDAFEGKEYEGALLYVTLSVNNFAYQSIEEIDPVDWWALLGSAGGVWDIASPQTHPSTSDQKSLGDMNISSTPASDDVPTAEGVSSEKPKCNGCNPWTKRLKRPIINDTQEKLTLKELLTDFVFGVAAGYDERQMSDELTELLAGYAQSKVDRPVQEQSLFTLTGKEGAQTTEQRLSVAMMKGKPELGRFVGDVEQSAPPGLQNVVSKVRAFVRPAGAGMPFHRDSINLGLDGVVLTLLSGPSDKPPEFHVKLMSGPNATEAKGPYGPDELHIPEDDGRIMVKGPIARGEQVRIVHRVEGGDLGSLTLVADYYTRRTDRQTATEEDRDRARASVVIRAESRSGATHNPFADSLVFCDEAPYTTGSRRGTEANNANGDRPQQREMGQGSKPESADGNRAGQGARTTSVDGVMVTVPEAVWVGHEAQTPVQQAASDQRSEDSARGGATRGTGANQVGSAPSDGAAAKARKPIPGQVNHMTAHGFCFGFGADGIGLAQKLHDKFAGQDGFGVGPITEGGCETPNFSKAGVTKGKSTWQLDENGHLILPIHNGNKTEGHPR
eukprot:g16331.t1